MKILLYIVVTILVLFGAAFIGNTSINNSSFSIERPYTAVAFIITAILAVLGK